ncbi:MAG TPA: hypothetical protein VIK27_04795 [Candidatus Aquilonibacter sp.]
MLLIVFAIGALFFTLGTAMVRRGSAALPAAPINESAAPWTAELAGTGDLLHVSLRVDMIERLAMLGEPWCAAMLQRARLEDDDATVRDAADAALLVIGARRRDA